MATAVASSWASAPSSPPPVARRAASTANSNTNRPTSVLSTREVRCPPLSIVSSSQTIVMLHTSSVRSPSRPNPSSSGSQKSRNPVAVISSPLRLSGRRRQAISPHATYAVPTSRNRMR